VDTVIMEPVEAGLDDAALGDDELALSLIFPISGGRDRAAWDVNTPSVMTRHAAAASMLLKARTGSCSHGPAGTEKP